MSGSGAGDATRPTLRPILVVEDDDIHARLVEGSLAHARLRNPVLRARDGDEAVAYMVTVASAASPSPALVLLDLELPGRSGIEVLEALAVMDRRARCPVIMMSASSEGASITRARELGVRGYLVKPVAFDALADVIYRLGLPWAILAPEDQ